MNDRSTSDGAGPAPEAPVITDRETLALNELLVEHLDNRYAASPTWPSIPITTRLHEILACGVLERHERFGPAPEDDFPFWRVTERGHDFFDLVQALTQPFANRVYDDIMVALADDVATPEIPLDQPVSSDSATGLGVASRSLGPGGARFTIVK